MRFENTLRINAPAAVVWDLTLDVSRWPEYTPTMQRIELLDPAPVRVGSRARIKQPMQPAAVWTVSALEPGCRFAWRSRRKGLTMVAAHLIEEIDDGSCRNTLSIEATGPGAGVLRLLLGAAFKNAIARENAGFKQAAERRR